MNTSTTVRTRWLDRLINLSAALGAACIAVVCLLMIAMSISREMNLNLRGGDDVIAWLCAASAFLILGQTFQHGGVVRVELLLDKLSKDEIHEHTNFHHSSLVEDRLRHLPRNARWWFEVVSLTIMVAFCVYATAAFGWFIYQSWEMNDLAQGQIVIPLWIPQTTALLGVTVFTLAVVDEWWRVVRRQKPRYQQMQEAKLAAGDFGETA